MVYDVMFVCALSIQVVRCMKNGKTYFGNNFLHQILFSQGEILQTWRKKRKCKANEVMTRSCSVMSTWKGIKHANHANYTKGKYPTRVSIQRAKVPRAKVPRESVSKASVPRENVLRENIRRENVPRANVPRVIAQGANVPRATIPKVNVPGLRKRSC